MVGEPQIFGLRAGSSLPFFESSGFGRARVGQNLLRTSGRAGRARYLWVPSTKFGYRAHSSLHFFLKFGLRAGSGPAKFASDKRAGGPSLIFMGTKYRFWESSSFEPTFFFEVRASGGLGPSKICFGRAGGRAEPGARHTTRGD